MMTHKCSDLIHTNIDGSLIKVVSRKYTALLWRLWVVLNVVLAPFVD
jgi:hypothetical protein